MVRLFWICVFVEEWLAGVVTDVETALDGSLVVTSLSGELLNRADFREALELLGTPVWRTVGDDDSSSELHRPRYADKLTIASAAEMEQLTGFFGLCMTRTTSSEKSPLILKSFPEQLPINRTAWVRLRGAQGAGKTVFLSALYNTLESELIDLRLRRTPLFVDAGKLRQQPDPHDATLRIIGEIEARFRAGKPALIVDGLTPRDHGISTRLCRQLCDRIDFRRTEAAIWSMSEDFEFIFDSIFDETIRKGRCDLIEIRMENKGPDDPDFEPFLESFAAVHARVFPGTTAPPDARRLKRFADRTARFVGRGDVDQHLLSLIYRSLDWGKYGQITSTEPFLKLYCSDRMFGNSFDVNHEKQDHEKQDDVLREAAWLAYRSTVNSFYSNSARTPQRFRIQPAEEGSVAQSLLEEHNNIREFLTAWHIYDRLRTLDGKQEALSRFVEDRVLDFDFTQIVSGHLRALLMIPRSNALRVLRSLRQLIDLLAQRPDSLPLTEAYIAYLLGRFPSDIVNPNPRDLLRTLEAFTKKRLKADDGSNRLFAQTGRRTVAVSQIKLRQWDIGEAFLRELLADPELAAIDRGYHRLYYGDCVAYRDMVPNCYLDVAGDNWRRTFRHLASRIREALPELANGTAALATSGVTTVPQERERLEQDTQHKIITLMLFVQSRLSIHSALEQEHREFAGRVIDAALSRDGWSEEVRPYLEMLLDDLCDPDAGTWRLVTDLYRLKVEPRRGWILRGMNPGAADNRVESVAEHSLMATLLQ